MESERNEIMENHCDTEAAKKDTVEKILSSVQTVGLAGLGGATEMTRKMKEFEEVRTAVLDLIEQHFEEGVDFGPADERNPKPVLLLPGAEKVCRWFDTHPRWFRDYETWEMLGKPAGTVCFVCQIVDNKTRKVIGEGRGAETVGNKKRDANKTIKNAEKCALVDAAKYTFMLSERFTQDDGGNGSSSGIKKLNDEKTSLKADIGVYRAGIKSEFSDIQWLTVVIEKELHKKRIDTLGEIIHIRKVTLETNQYDKSTGERLSK